MTPSPATTDSLFLDRPDVYDAMIDWPTRLSREEPFYRRLFSTVQARRVLDVACGTGHHAAMFRDWGMEIEAADLSPAMISFCKARHGESDSLRWICRSFDHPAAANPPFDVVLCKGNSLALAPDLACVTRVVHAMMHAVRPGGVCMIGLLNLHRLPEGQIHWQKQQHLAFEGRDHFLLKGVHRHRNCGYLETILVRQQAEHSRRVSHASRLLLIEDGMLHNLLRDHGASDVACYGSYVCDPYDRAHSQDLILVAHKA